MLYQILHHQNLCCYCPSAYNDPNILALAHIYKGPTKFHLSIARRLIKEDKNYTSQSSKYEILLYSKE